MLQHLQTEFRDSIARGDSYAQVASKMAERFDVGHYDARRLVATESAFVFNQSHKTAYIDAGVEEYEISAIMDNKTSRICRSMDGKKFRFDEMEVGTNFPPFHAFCRTTFIGVLDGMLDDESHLLPDYENTVIPDAKLTKYALDPDGTAPDKAIAFEKALGYNKGNYQDLIKDIRENLPKFEAEYRGHKGYGDTYQVIMKLIGPNGKTANVLTAWLKDDRTGKTRLTSIYVDRRKR